MRSNDQSFSLFESRCRKPGLNLAELLLASGFPNGAIRDDFDELQRSQEQLRTQVSALQTQNEELKAYAHMISHDLKDPLVALILASDLINKHSDLSRRELKEYLVQIRSTAYEMDKIINSLLLFAEIDKAEAPAEPVDMDQVVASVLDRLSYMIKEYGAKVDVSEVWPEALGYAPWITEVWANFLSNAIKHGGRPPHVELGATAQSDGMVRFWTRDNGPGISPKARARLFTPYCQLGHVRDRGHGVGLSIAHSIVEKLGGQVGVESELGQGSTFFFSLPTCAALTC